MEARFGLLHSVSAFIEVNPPMPSSVTEASEPPVHIISAYPSRIWRNASPIALVALAHAVTTLVQMPFAPSSIAIHPAPIFTINIGTKNGDTRS